MTVPIKSSKTGHAVQSTPRRTTSRGSSNAVRLPLQLGSTTPTPRITTSKSGNHHPRLYTGFLSSPLIPQAGGISTRDPQTHPTQERQRLKLPLNDRIMIQYINRTMPRMNPHQTTTPQHRPTAHSGRNCRHHQLMTLKGKCATTLPDRKRNSEPTMTFLTRLRQKLATWSKSKASTRKVEIANCVLAAVRATMWTCFAYILWNATAGNWSLYEIPTEWFAAVAGFCVCKALVWYITAWKHLKRSLQKPGTATFCGNCREPLICANCDSSVAWTDQSQE